MMVFLPFTVCYILTLGIAYGTYNHHYYSDYEVYPRKVDYTVNNYPREVDDTVFHYPYEEYDAVNNYPYVEDVTVNNYPQTNKGAYEYIDAHQPQFGGAYDGHQPQFGGHFADVWEPYVGVNVDTSAFIEAVEAAVIAQANAGYFIGEIEKAILNYTLFQQKSTHIPMSLAQLEWRMIDANLDNVMSAKERLSTFFGSIFENQAKALYGTLGVLSDFYFKTRGWARICIETCGSDCIDLPAIGGFGPCGGVWPCTRTMVCKTYDCLTRARIICLESGGINCYGEVEQIEVPMDCPIDLVIDPCPTHFGNMPGEPTVRTTQGKRDTGNTTQQEVEITTEHMMSTTQQEVVSITEQEISSTTVQEIEETVSTTEQEIESTTEHEMSSTTVQDVKDTVSTTEIESTTELEISSTTVQEMEGTVGTTEQEIESTTEQDIENTVTVTEQEIESTPEQEIDTTTVQDTEAPPTEFLYPILTPEDDPVEEVPNFAYVQGEVR